MSIAQTTQVSRRTLFKGAGLVAVGAAATAVASPAAAAPALAKPLHSLPVAFGTPTDLARTNPKTAYTRDPDGVVYQFDKPDEVWVKARQQHWPAVLAHGSAQLARWGRPSGRNQLVVVLGDVPDPAPTTTSTPTTTLIASTTKSASATVTRTTTSSTRSTSSARPTTSTRRPIVSPSRSTMSTARSTPTVSGSRNAIPGQSGPTSTPTPTPTPSWPELPATGVSAEPLSLAGAAAVLAGAGVLGLAARRNRVRAARAQGQHRSSRDSDA